MSFEPAQIAFDPRWSTAVPDWVDRIKKRNSLFPDLPLHAERADRALRIFKNLRVPDIEGTPTYGEVCEEFVFDLVRAIFGAFDEETNLRIIREYFLLIPKKNGKTSIAAAIIVVALILNERPSATALLIAPTQKIAEMSFNQAAGIIRLSDTPSGTPLTDLFSVHSHLRTIKYLHAEIPSEMTVKAADKDVVTGSKATYILIDETHEFASHRQAEGVFLEIRGGLSHPQNKGFLLQITTQSKVPPFGVFKKELTRARKVRDGAMAVAVLPILYEFPPEIATKDKWRDPAVWGMVNPHLGRSVDIGFLADELAKVEEDRESLALFASQHLNVEIGMSLNGEQWDGARHWAECAVPILTLSDLLSQCDVATVGVDWGGADDLAAVSVIGRRESDRAWLHWMRAWARPSVFEQRKAIAEQLRGFEADGDLRIVASGEDQAEEAADVIAEVVASGLVPEQNGIGLDAYGVALLIDALEARQISAPQVVAVGQGYKLASAISSLPLKLESKRMLHAGQPIMDWAVGNTKQELRGTSYVVTKAVAGAAKIDPVMAMFNAGMLMLMNPQAGRRKLSPWDLDPEYRMPM